MKKPIFIILLTVGFLFFLGQMALAEEGTTPTPDPVIGDDTTAGTEEPSGSRFNSRELLIETLLNGQPPAPEEPGDTGTDDTSGSDDTSGGDDAGTGDTGGSGDTTDEGDTGDEEPTTDARVEAFVESLSDEQVFAFNRALNNAVKSQLYSEIIYDLDLLESLDVENLTKQDINAITKAFEEEAKFNKLYAKTGNVKFLTMAETKKAKFLAKAGIVWDGGDTGTGDEGSGDDTGTDTGSTPNDSGSDTKGATLSATKDVKMAAVEARKAAKLEAKAAKKAAKSAVKDAKKEAKAAAKEAKKQSKGNKGKGKGKKK